MAECSFRKFLPRLLHGGLSAPLLPVNMRRLPWIPLACLNPTFLLLQRTSNRVNLSMRSLSDFEYLPLRLSISPDPYLLAARKCGVDSAKCERHKGKSVRHIKLTARFPCRWRCRVWRCPLWGPKWSCSWLQGRWFTDYTYLQADGRSWTRYLSEGFIQVGRCSSSRMKFWHVI